MPDQVAAYKDETCVQAEGGHRVLREGSMIHLPVNTWVKKIQNAIGTQNIIILYRFTCSIPNPWNSRYVSGRCYTV